MERPVTIEPGRGVYAARRAAALAGVPMRTLHDWAHKGFYRPSIAPGPRVRLWSWADLLALRAIDWLRRRKEGGDEPRVPFAKLRAALAELESEGLTRHDVRTLVVSHAGHLYFMPEGETVTRASADRQIGVRDMLHLVSPYLGQGPDLLDPRPLLRIIPGKLHGEPHVVDTRIPTAAIFSLDQDGYTRSQIRSIYPDASADAVSQAIDLEFSLQSKAA